MMILQLPQWESDLDRTERRASLLRQLEDWIASAPLRQLASSWNSAPRQGMIPIELFTWYDDFSSRHWDFRAGRERNVALSVELTPIQEEATFAAANAMGLIAARDPLRSQYDFLLILGGLVRACVTRPRYARELIEGGLSVGTVIALGGFRPLGGDELALSRHLDIAADNEFGAMVAGIRNAFPGLGEVKIEQSSLNDPGNADWAVARFGGAPISVIAAPSREPEKRRANTADTFAWWAAETKDLDRAHVLLVTNPIYVPYQGAAAIESLGIPFDLTVETIGISATAADLGVHTQSFGPSNYLQEIRSAIRGYKSLYEAASHIKEVRR